MMRVVLRSLKSSFRHWNDDGNLRFIQRLPGFKWELTKRPQLINTDDDTDTHLHDKKKAKPLHSIQFDLVSLDLEVFFGEI